MFWTQKICSTKMFFWNKNVFWLKIFSNPNFLLDPTIFLSLNFCLDPKFLGPRICLDPNLLDQKFFASQTLTVQKIFPSPFVLTRNFYSSINFLGTKLFLNPECLSDLKQIFNPKWKTIFGWRKLGFWTSDFLNSQWQRFYFNWTLTLKTESSTILYIF